MISPSAGNVRSDCRSPGRGGRSCAGLDVRRRIELAEAAQVRALRPDVGQFQQHAARQFVLDARVPLLHVRRGRCGSRPK